MRIKLLHILYSGQGGLGTYFMNFVRQDKNSKFEHFALFYGIEPLADEYESFCIDRGINFEFVPRRAKLDLEAFRVCRTIAEENEITYVLLHTFSLSPFYLFSRKCLKIISIDHTPYQVKTRLEWLYSVLNHLFAFKAIYFYPEQFLQIKKRVLFLKAGTDTKFIPKTVDTELFVSGKGDYKRDSTLVLGTSARIIKGKRHDLIIEAIDELVKSGFNIMLKIAGDGPLLKRYKKQVNDLGLGSNIFFEGRLNTEQMLEFYQSLNVFIHASEGETNCYCIMEAQACGIPVLASDVEGINNVIKHNEDGLLFENNKGAILNCIETVSESVNMNYFSTRSRELAEQNFARNNQVQAFYDLIKETV